MFFTNNLLQYDTDPFGECCTIASLALRVFRRCFLKVEVGILPRGAYRHHDRQSVTAMRWLAWEAQRNDIDIRTTVNGREHHVDQYKLDGYVRTMTAEGEERQIGYEFHGCYCMNVFAILIIKKFQIMVARSVSPIVTPCYRS